VYGVDRSSDHLSKLYRQHRPRNKKNLDSTEVQFKEKGVIPQLHTGEKKTCLFSGREESK